MRAGDGAYPYEVWNAFRKALEGIFHSEEAIKMIQKTKGIKLNHEVVNGELVGELEFTETEHPYYHIPSLKSFMNYFKILTSLG